MQELHMFKKVSKRLEELREKALNEGGIARGDAFWLMGLPEETNKEVMDVASEVRESFFSNVVDLCSIVNAKSGMCGEDCAFCAQSRVSSADIKRYSLISPESIIAAAETAKQNGARRFGIVTSGRGVAPKELQKICEAAAEIREKVGIEVDLLAGIIEKKEAEMLREAGISHYNHNLETSPEFFPRLCTTHSFDERLTTLRILKEEGIELCCGGIFGVGETDRDRVELAFLLKGIGVKSIPVNFLHPIPGTPLENLPTLSPSFALRIISAFRLINPSATIRVCGGRERVLGEFQRLIFRAGANATMVGNYLTTTGNHPEEDHKMIAEAGMKVNIELKESKRPLKKMRKGPSFIQKT